MTTARKFGLDFVGDIPWGTHLCQFYDTKHDLIDILVPYFAEGLRSNEACMWVTSEPLGVEEATEALKKAVPNIDRFIKNGQLLILPYKEWYLKGGTFDADRVLQGWVEKEEEALSRGFEGLRLTGNTFWIERDLWDSFTDYEEAVNNVIGAHRMIAVCTYSLKKCSGSDVTDVIRNHVGTIIKKGATWSVVEDVAHRKEAEENLRQRGDMLDLANDAVIILNLNGYITYWNKGAERLYGWTSEEAIGQNVHEFLRKEHLTSIDDILSVLYREGAWNGEIIHTTRDNARIIVESHWTLYRGSDGKPLAIFEINKDITEQKRAEENAERLAKFPEENPNPVMRLSAEGEILYVNKPAKRLLNDWNGTVEGTAPQPLRDAAIDTLSNKIHKTIEVEIGSRVFEFFVTSVPDVGYANVYGQNVTERKQVEAEIVRRSEMLDLAHDAIFVRDVDSRITYWNQGAERLYGWKEEEALGKVTHDLFQTVFPEPLNVIMHSLYRDGAWEGDLIHRTQDNRRIVVESRWTLHRDSEGKPSAIFEINKDITERKKAEEKLQQAHEEVQALNEELQSMNEELLSMNETLEERVKERTIELQNEIEERQVVEEELRTAWEDVRAAALYSRSLIEASLDPLVTISAEGKISDVNKATEEITGVSREQLIGSDFSSYFSNPEKAEEVYQKVFSKGIVQDYPLTIRHIWGKITDVMYNATVYRNEAGEIQGVFAAARDVTALKAAEEEVRAASRYLRNLIEVSLDPLITIGSDGTITDANKATEEVTGLSREQLIGTNFSDYFTDPVKAEEGYYKVLADGFVRNYPLAFRHPSGRRVDVLYNAVVYLDEDGKMQGVFAAARDVTEQKQAEKALKQAHDELEQKVKERTRELKEEIEEHKVTEEELRVTTEELQRSNKELEQFAYIASHDLQEPLRTVTSAIGLLEKGYKDKLGEEADTFIAYTVDGTKQMQQLIKDLLAYSRIMSRGEAFTPVLCDVVVQRAIDNLKVAIEESGVTIKIPTQPLPTVMGDRTQLTQLFQNLIGNAIKFRSEQPPEVQIDAELDGGGKMWQFSVKDNGIGMDMQYSEKIFTIFQRLHTTEQYAGTGVGLALCKKIVERHNGEIWVDSKLGKGTTFHFTLPFYVE